MSKICQCRQQRLLKYLYSRKTPLANELVAAQIIQELESDCVCEKNCKCSNQEPFTDVRKKGDVRCWKCAETISKEEKQSQSPCTCDSAFYINSSGVHRPDCIANTNQQKVQSPCEHPKDRVTELEVKVLIFTN
jgi:hypothetical protein